MSYARFGAGGSDVYVFATNEVLECCGCALRPRSTWFTTTAAMLEHLAEHQAAGHTVLEETIAHLRVDAEENDGRFREVIEKRRQKVIQDLFLEWIEDRASMISEYSGALTHDFTELRDLAHQRATILSIDWDDTEFNRVYLPDLG